MGNFVLSIQGEYNTMDLDINQYEFDPSLDGKSYNSSVMSLLSRDELHKFMELSDIEYSSLIDILSHRIKYKENLPQFIVDEYDEDLEKYGHIVTYRDLYDALSKDDPQLLLNILIDISSQESIEYLRLWIYSADKNSTIGMIIDHKEN